MATYSSILVWRIPWIEEPGGLQSMGLQNQTQLKWLNMLLARTFHWITNSPKAGTISLLSKNLFGRCSKKKKKMWIEWHFCLPWSNWGLRDIRAGALCSFVHSSTQQRFADSLLGIRHRAWDMPISNFHIKFSFPLQIMFYRYILHFPL